MVCLWGDLVVSHNYKMHQLILDSYIPKGYLKIIAIYFCLGFILATINIFSKLKDPYQLLLGLLLALISTFLLIGAFGRKAILVSDEKIYVCLMLGSWKIFKKGFKKSSYSEFKIIEKKKTELPLLFKYSFLDIFSQKNAFIVYLTNTNSKTYHGLVAVSDIECETEIKDFLFRWTHLKEV